MPIVKNGRIAGSSIFCLNKVRKKIKEIKSRRCIILYEIFTGLMLTDIAQAKKKEVGDRSRSPLQLRKSLLHLGKPLLRNS